MILKMLQRAGWVTAGNIVGQLSVLAATLWLARMYTPADFGLFALVLVISNVSVAVASFRFDVAIPAASEDDAKDLTLLATVAVLVSATVLTAALRSAHALSIFSIPLIEEQIWLVFLTIIASGTFQIFTARLVREERFKTLGVLRGAQGISFVAFASVPAIGLLWSQALSLLWGLAILPSVVSAARLLKASEITTLLRRHWTLPALSLPGAALDVVGYSMVIWVIIGSYGTSDAGIYSQLQRLLGGPLMLISMSLGQVMLRQTVDHLGNSLALQTMLSRVLLGLGALVLVAVITVTVVGTPVLSLILGDQWIVDPMMAILITIAVGVRACVSPLSSALISLRRFDVGLVWQASYFASAVVLFPWMASQLSFGEFVAFYAMHEAVLYTLYLALIWRAVSRSEVR